MTNCEKLYRYYCEHPAASAAEVMDALQWDADNVRRYKFRLKQRGFIAVDDNGILILKPFSSGDDPEKLFDFKQQTYREIIDNLKERMALPGTTTPQAIEIGREIRIILKEIV